jgi:hypothetical protein
MDVVSLPARRCVRLPSVSSGFGPSTVLALKEDFKIGETVRVCGHETQAKLWEMSDMVKVLEDWEALRTAV